MNELETMRNALSIRKYEWVPIIGTMLYMWRIGFKAIKMEDPIRKAINKGQHKLQLPVLIIIIPFAISFFVLRNRYGYGPWPWFFWVGVGLGSFQLSTPLIWKYLYRHGLNTYQKALPQE